MSKSAHYRGCFRFNAARIWYDLPPPLRHRMTVDTFRNKCKSETVCCRKSEYTLIIQESADFSASFDLGFV